MSEYKMLIGGELFAGDDYIDVINPANETVVGRCPVASLGQLDQAVDAATAALPDWRDKSYAERGQYIARLTAALADRAEEFAKLLTLEQGKTLSAARDEVAFAQAFANYFSEQVLESEVLIDDDSQRVEIHREALGVVAGICPWNFPLLITMYKLGPALVTGNTLILKPAPTTPLSSLLLGELIKDIFPPGVVNIIADDNSLGEAITSHPGIAKISFTGSTPTGKKIMASAAGTLKRLTLELGGNDAAIVLDDVDVDAAAEGIFSAAFLNSGQVCIALKRLYVHDAVYDRLCDKLAALAQQAVVGDGLDEATEFGPVQNRQQFNKVCGYVEDARKHGEIIAGGVVPDKPGFCVPLTIVKNIQDGTAVVDEEPFGPVLPVVKFSDIDEVVKRANASPFGLGGSVWSADIDRARAIAAKLNAGTVWINQHCAFGPHIPFPPAKESGLGVEWGREGLCEFTAMKVINILKS